MATRSDRGRNGKSIFNAGQRSLARQDESEEEEVAEVGRRTRVHRQQRQYPNAKGDRSAQVNQAPSPFVVPDALVGQVAATKATTPAANSRAKLLLQSLKSRVRFANHRAALLALVAAIAIWTILLPESRLASGAITAGGPKPPVLSREIEKQIVDKILGEGYDKRIRPSGINNKTGQNDGPAVVRVNTLIRSISKIDDVTMEYSVQLSLRQEWVDERLAFNKMASYKSYNINSITLTEQERLWKPDLFFRNEKEGHFHKIIMPNVLLRINGDGSVLYSIRISLVLACPMDLKYYPLDKQNCTIEMASYGYLDDDLKFIWKEKNPVQINQPLTLPRFTLESSGTAFCTSRTATGAYSCLRVDLIFKREFSYYLIQIYIPCCMLVIVSWVSFWLDPNAIPARVSLGVTTLLTMATQISGINASLPPVSYTKAIDVWTGVCLTFVFGALLEFALVNYASRSDAHARVLQARQEEELRIRELEYQQRQQLAAAAAAAAAQQQQQQHHHHQFNQQQGHNQHTYRPQSQPPYAGYGQMQYATQKFPPRNTYGQTNNNINNNSGTQKQPIGGQSPNHIGQPPTAAQQQQQYTVINTAAIEQQADGATKIPNGLAPAINGIGSQFPFDGANAKAGQCEIHHSLLHPMQTRAQAAAAGNNPSGPRAAVAKKNVNFCRAWLNKFPSRSKRIDVISRIFFPKMFALFNLVYWTTYLFREDDIVQA